MRAGPSWRRPSRRRPRCAQEIMEILLTREADRAMFKMVYPFSPALIQALVAVSSALQRERTALKIMLQLLVNRRDTLRLGDVIPLGDLWDVVAHGDEAFTDVMRVNFENAKKLYQNKLLPMLEQQHEIDLEVDRETGEDEHGGGRAAAAVRERRPAHQEPAAVRPGPRRRIAQEHDLHAAGCPEPRDDPLPHSGPGASGRRPEAAHLGGHRWARSGSARSRPTRRCRSSSPAWTPRRSSSRPRATTTPATASSRSGRCSSSRWASPSRTRCSSRTPSCGGGASGPATCCSPTSAPCPTSRCGPTRTGSSSSTSRSTRKGHSPIEDLDRLSKFRDKNERQRTLVWLPSFFSTRTQGELGKLVIIDRLLLGNNLDQHAKHLSLQDRETARLLLKNQQSALSQRLLQAVEAAYAIRSEPTPGTLDAAYDMSESHFQSLFPTLVLQRPVGANLGEALEHLLDQALSHQFPKHPKFGQEIKFGKDLRQVLEVCQEAARTPDGRVFVEDKAAAAEAQATSATRSNSGRCRRRTSSSIATGRTTSTGCWPSRARPHPTVGGPAAVDGPARGTGPAQEIQNLLILVYADQTNRSFVSIRQQLHAEP